MYSAIFVDFDDTLYIHEDHWTKEENTRVEWEYATNKRDYSCAYLNNNLITMLHNIKKDNPDVSIIMLTTNTYSKAFNKKVDFIRYYANSVFDNYQSVGSSKEKISIIKYYCNDNNFNNEEKALLIDNNIFTCAAANKEGIKAVTPQFYERYSKLMELNEITF